MKLATWKKVSATVLGSLVFGGTVYLVTKPKAKKRKENIKIKQQTLEQAKYLVDKIKEANKPQATTYVLTNPTKADDSFKDVMSPIITNK